MALLGERIAQLFDPAPEVDPENVFDDDTIAKNERIETGIDVELNPSRIRDIDLGDAYKGTVISRDELNEWNNNNNNNDDELQFDDDEDDDIDNNTEQLRVIPVIDSDDDDVEDNVDDDDEDEFDTLFEDENEKIAGFDMDLINNNKSNKHSLDRFNDFGSMMNAEMDKADKLQKKEEQRIIKKQSKPHSFQLRKANAVSSQTKLYDKVATLRIHLQKPFQIAQKLPRPSIHCDIIKDIDNKKKDKINNESLLQRIALMIENPQRILYKMQSVDKLFKMYGDDGNINNNNNDDDDNDDGMENVPHLKFEKYRIELLNTL